MVLPAEELHPKAAGDSRERSLSFCDLQASESLIVTSEGNTAHVAHQKPLVAPYLGTGVIWSFTRFLFSLR